MPGIVFGSFGFSSNPTIRPSSSISITPKFPRASSAGSRTQATVRQAFLSSWKRPQEPVVHLVDVIAREDEDEAGLLVLDEVGVLADGVGRALVPAAPELLLGRDLVDELVQARAEDVPARLQVVGKRVRLVLRQDVDPPEPGVDAVGQGEVDDPEDAAEGDRRLGPDVGQRTQALTLAPRHDERKGVFHRALLSPRRPSECLPQEAYAGIPACRRRCRRLTSSAAAGRTLAGGVPTLP